MNDIIQTALVDSTSQSRSFIIGEDTTVVVTPEQYQPPTFSLSVSPSSVQEGGEFVVRAVTTNISNSTRLFVTVGGTGSAVVDDFNNDHWVMVIDNNKGVVRVTPKIDSIVEVGETVQFLLRTDRPTGAIVAEAVVANITDIPAPAVAPALPPKPAPAPFPSVLVPPIGPAKSYSISINPSVLTEGAFNYVSIYTTNVPDGTQLYITVGGTGNATANDFIGYPLTTTVARGNASRSIFAILDGIVENETVQLELRTGSPTGPIVAVSNPLSVLDTSGGTVIPPIGSETYFAMVSPTSVEEGNPVLVTVATSGIPDGTVLYFTPTGAGGTSDFVGSPWSATVSGNQASASIAVTADGVVEGNELVQFQVRTGSSAGPIVALTPSVTLRDPGSTSGTYSIAASPTLVGEGDSINVTVTTQNVTNGTTLFIGLDAGSSSGYSDFEGAPWAVTINNNTASRSIVVAEDASVEGNESFQFNLRVGSTNGPIVAVANSVTIDSAMSTDTYAISASPNSLDEGQVITLTVNTTSVPNGTQLYISAGGTGTATNDDFVTMPRSITVNSNAGTSQVTVYADEFTEGSQTAQFQLRTGSSSGTVVASSNLVTLNDTSLTPVTGSVLSVGSGAASYPENTTSYAFFSVTPALASAADAAVSVTPTNGATGADITGSLYVAYSSGGGYSTDVAVIGGTVNVPLGTTSIRLSVNLASDALTETGEGLLYSVQPAAVIPFSATTAVTQTIGITDAGTGGGGGASAITVIAGNSVAEGNYAYATYLVSPATSAAATVVATVAGDSGGSEADITRPLQAQFSSNGGASYSIVVDVPTDGIITVPSGTNRIRLRVLTIADGVTEGPETARFVVAQSVEGIFTNSWYVDQAIGITDSGGGGGGGTYMTMALVSAPASVAVNATTTPLLYSFNPGNLSQPSIDYSVDFVDDALNVVTSNPLTIEYRLYNGSTWSTWYSGLALGNSIWADVTTQQIEVRALADRLYTTQTKLRFTLNKRTLDGFETNSAVLTYVSIT